MKIVVLGTVGLIQAVWLAKIWYQVTAIDVIEEKIQLLKKGISPIYEAWLTELLHEVKDNIEFTTDKSSIPDADIVFLCVPTPQDEERKNRPLISSLSWNPSDHSSQEKRFWLSNQLYHSEQIRWYMNFFSRRIRFQVIQNFWERRTGSIWFFQSLTSITRIS